MEQDYWQTERNKVNRERIKIGVAIVIVLLTVAFVIMTRNKNLEPRILEQHYTIEQAEQCFAFAEVYASQDERIVRFNECLTSSSK